MNLSTIRKAYFLGIGGIGMSAIARYFNDSGITVYGYDANSTALTKTLEREGMYIHYHEDTESIPADIDIVVFTPAIPVTNTEYQYLQSSQIPMYKRAKVLGMISQDYQTIAVAGTHGKTSTSAVLSYMLTQCGIDSIALLGGIVKNWMSNYQYGKGDWLVAEADEYDRSFLHLHPTVAVILSMDADHLDIYGTHQQMIATYEQFTHQIKDGGMLIIGVGLKELFSTDWSEQMEARDIRIAEFGEAADIEVMAMQSQGFLTTVNANVENTSITWQWSVPGWYNASNASIAVAIAKYLNCDEEAIKQSLVSYQGVSRRMELVTETETHVLIDDYGHHPVEIASAYTAIRELYPDCKLTVIFQPHLYSRTQDHFKGFAEVLSRFDSAYVLPIYPARELPIEGITSEMIVREMTLANAKAVQHHELAKALTQKKHEIIVTMGAGNLPKHHETIKKLIDKANGKTK